MTHIIEGLYCVAALIAIGACVPQIRQILRTKASDELSLSTWSIWLATQCVTLAYVASIHNYVMAVVNIAWVSFYAAMVALIVRYRRPSPRLAPEEIEA